jgi:ubiquitin carboxyl-terminal hydrolase 47
VTTSLTKSFHWTSHQSFEQQDVQEFCRVLFDAIDKSFKLKLKEDDAVVTNDSSMSDLYEGISQSYVKCLTCRNESV